MRTVIGLVVFVFLVSALLRHDALESLLFALALAVGILPMIMTVTLAAGAQRMAQGNVIVKRLEAIENLGTMDVLCSDKTGTLTRGALRLHVRGSAVDLERRSGSVSRRVVYRIAGHADAGYLPYPYAGNPFKSRPSPALLITVAGGVVAGLLIVISPLGGLLGPITRARPLRRAAR